MHRYVRDNIRYVRDVRRVETLQTPLRTLENASGDCDDKATLFAALAESIGFATRFVAYGREPARFSHVIAEVRHGDRWLGAETTEPVALGWRPKMPYRMTAHV